MDEIQLISKDLIEKVVTKAKKVPRKRMNHNFHASFDDPINRMLNAMEPGTYCRPHKHENPDKREVFIVLRGKLAVILFNDDGKIMRVIKLIPKEGFYGAEIPAKTWHTIVSLEQGSIAYEIKDGPYNVEDDKNFAPWAPEEDSLEAPAYLKNILEQI